jgi:Protein of unknown function (DUF2867)
MTRQGLAYVRHMPALAPLLKNADHVDVKTVIGTIDMRTFLANMLSYQPDWMRLLYHIRAGFVPLLGIHQKGIPTLSPLLPEEVPMQEGQKALFFKVRMVEEEHYWIAGVDDKHLEAFLGVVIEQLPDTSLRRFHVLTIVHYHNWTGPVYFQAIQPFHHLVVGNMAKAGVHSPHLQKEASR